MGRILAPARAPRTRSATARTSARPLHTGSRRARGFSPAGGAQRRRMMMMTIRMMMMMLGCCVARGGLNLWIDANQARVLIGFEEDIFIVSEAQMAPFTQDFRSAQRRIPAIPVGVQRVNFTWRTTEQAEYFYEFQTLRSLDKHIMDDPTVSVPLLGSVPLKASVVQVGFPCRGEQDGVAAFEVTVLVMDAGGNVILRTPHNAIFFKTCQRAKCPGGCRNGGFCNERQVCECQDGFYGPHCEKALCSPGCLNGGLCVSPGVCICPPGYSGVSCDRVNCSATCLNGGTCFHPGKCLCPAGHEGERCQTSKCRQPCRNGGRCVGRNKCKCSKGFHGDLCSKAACEPSCGTHGTCVEPNRCQCRDGWHGRHCNKKHRGGVASRPPAPKNKPHAAPVKESEDTGETNQQPDDTNYVA
ncbi:wnt inhibitory factor 1 [Denticeps clupeoides]|uniref:Wnt inhibitory factor 1 n=1 Tax=Denticeps clupeoides TaxID=299321 RepID=A0AAY4DG41_9TELE|nr:wnt inhibitory factor 1 [Denticeps clupeoides]